MNSPTSQLRTRFGAAINWRVRDALAVQLPASGLASATDLGELKAEVVALRIALADASASFADRIRSLELLVEQLDRQLASRS